MADDIISSQVSSAKYTARFLLEMFPFSGVCVFGPKFHYNTFLASNRRIG